MSEHVRHQITLYLDDELLDEEKQVFEAHLATCRRCLAELERERALVSAIRQIGPLHTAPESLRERIVQLLGQARPIRWLGQPRIWLLVAATLVVGLGVSLWYIARVGSQPSDFSLLAVESHQRSMRGQLPLEVKSHSPEDITSWFAGKLPFNLKLPDYPVAPGQLKPYEIAGARLVGFRDDYAAYIAYRLGDRSITLLVTSQTLSEPSGAIKIPWQDFQLYLDAINGWRVLSWSGEGLTYVLVSDFEERGQTFCSVCHPGAQELKRLEGLKPK